MAKTVRTTWDLRTYDVWGNAKDGYEVNDTFGAGSVELRLKVELCNAGTPQEFTSAYPSAGQVQRVLGTRAGLSLDGDDTCIYVNRERDSYPLAELHCTSHASLSPVRVANA